MKCATCHRPIRPGMESDKRIEYWRQPDGSTLMFGVGMDAGLLSAATGQLAQAKHNKCFYTQARREQRGGDAVLGSALAQAALALEDEDD